MAITTPADVGAALRQQREKLGLSQVQLAAKIGTTPGRLSRFERGDGATNLRTLLSLLAALNLQLTIIPRETDDERTDQDEDDEIDLDAIVNTGLKPSRRSAQR
jgi:HTH-type transcriptional regulator/antitoxin HipB